MSKKYGIRIGDKGDLYFFVEVLHGNEYSILSVYYSLKAAQQNNYFKPHE